MMGFDCQDVLTISNALVCVCRKKKKRIIEEGEDYFVSLQPIDLSLPATNAPLGLHGEQIKKNE